MTKQDSKRAVAYRVDGGQPWMGLPGVSMGDVSVDEMFKAANLHNWDVRTREVITDATTDSPDFEVIRNDPFTKGGLNRLAMAKGRYTPVQNEGIRDLANNIAHGDVKPVAMGAMKSGRQVFMSFQLGENIVLDPNGQADEIGRFLTILTSHDGTLSVVGMTGNLRMACQNQIRSMRSQALGSFKMRHTQSVAGRVAEARHALSVATKQSVLFEQDMQKLVSVSVTDQKFWELVTKMDPMPESDVRGSVKKWEGRTDLAMALWRGEADGGNTVANLDKTAYLAYMALNERLMWYPIIRAGNVENALVGASGFNEFTNKQDLKLYKSVLSLV